jgi:hypothetical protein
MQDTEHLEAGKAGMRGLINTIGIEGAAGIWADAFAGPFNEVEHANIWGAFLAAFDAGRLHQETITRRTAI